ncbi:hypothetical protein HMPREF1221_00197 [Treponema socranskii subsp. paredis ATCC 35535]|nr:hypothetical protein HMPREF1221_00197 [Treponema socranskii subsp. paredis ATCC 35535]
MGRFVIVRGLFCFPQKVLYTKIPFYDRGQIP